MGPLLFNIYLNNLFHQVESAEVCNFPGDAIFFACDKDLKTFTSRLEQDGRHTIPSFTKQTYNLLVLEYKYENLRARIDEAKIWESSKQKLLGGVIDRDLIVNENVSSPCEKTGKKLTVKSIKSNELLIKSFVEAQFG